MSDDRLKTGDVVKLKSGSAPMTISYENEFGRLECCWWNSLTQNVERGDFNQCDLKKCDSGSAKGE